MTALFPMATDANYPSDNGSSVSNMSGIPCLMDWSFVVAGVPGSGASYQPQVKTERGNWVNVGTALTAAGVTSGKAWGTAMRLVAANGSGAGTAGNIPCYYLDLVRRRQIPTKHSAG